MLLPITLLFLIIAIFAIYYAVTGVKQKESDKNKTAKNPAKEYHTKIKDIYLELHNYSYYHSPSGINKADKRFIGRQQVIHKLKSIFLRTSTRAGTYLVTGFRGMGKTSLVNNVINELKGTDANSMKRLGRIVVFLILGVVLHVFDFQEKSTPFTRGLSYLLIVIDIALVLYWIHKDTLRRRRYKHSAPEGYAYSYSFGILPSLLRLLDMNSRYYRRSEFLTIAQELFVGSLLVAIALWAERLNVNKPYNILLAIVTYLVLQQCIQTTVFVKASNYKPENRRKAFWFYITSYFNIFAKKINHGQLVPVKISLAQNNLRDIDVLKVISKSIYNQYRELRSFNYSVKRLVVYIFGTFLAYMLACTIYYTQNFYNVTNDMRTGSNLVYYAPSQALIPALENNEQQVRDFVYGIATNTVISDINNWKNEVKNVAGIDFDTLSRNSEEIIRRQTMESETRQVGDTVITQSLTANTNLSEGDGNWLSYYTRVADYYFFLIYIKGRHLLLGDSTEEEVNAANVKMNRVLPSGLQLSDSYMLMPLVPDYYLLIYLILVYLGFRLFYRFSHRFGLVHHRYIMRLLKDLNERLEADVTITQGGTIGSASGNPFFSFLRQRNVHRPIGGVREIESDLIYLFNQIDRIPALLYQPQFIFIFDELDKINPAEMINGLENTDQVADRIAKSPWGNGKSLELKEIPRIRLLMVQELLSNLKLFFNTAKAKFIFIAGREMYDAAQADVADRESLLGSIFHDVIYVNSFYKDPIFEHSADVDTKDSPSSITTLTERYVCQFLLPPGGKYANTIAGYSEYVKDNFFPDFLDNDEERKLTWEKRTKVIYTLRNFITYLTYRSHGSPMRVITLLEDYIVNMDDYEERDELLDRQHNLVVGQNNNSLYLNFDFYIQYKFGYVASIFRPYLLSRAGVLKDFEDKVLVGSTYIMDHLYRFHAFGFSWRNLELTPEIIHIHKAPQLRKFIKDLLTYLSNMAIRPVTNGLHQYKFAAKFVLEFDYISKIFERESAAFNFTLDENQPVKLFYREKLLSLKNANQSVDATNQKYIHSIGFVEMILGDVQYFDKEYDEALVNYTEAIQWLRDQDAEDISVYQTVLLVRNMLKLGLTLERMNTFDAALTAYGQLTELVRRSGRWINKKALKARRERGIPGETVVEQLENKDKYKSWQYTDVDDEDVKLEKSYYLNKDLFEGLPMLYLPLLCKLHIIEKASPTGITHKDVYRTVKAFDKIYDNIGHDEKFLLKAHFIASIGNILYYKNGEPFDSVKQKEVNSKNSKSLVNYYREHYLNSESFDYHKDYKPPSAAYVSYQDSLSLILDNIYFPLEAIQANSIECEFIKKDISIQIKCLKLLDMELNYLNHTSFSTELLEQIAEGLSNFADSLLCFIHKNDTLDNEFATNILQSIANHKVRLLSDDLYRDEEGLINHLYNQNSQTARRLHQILLCYALSGRYYYRAERRNSYAFQLKKVIYLIKMYNKFHPQTTDSFILNTSSLKTIKIQILREMLRATSNAKQNIIFQEHSKFKDEFGLPEKEMEDIEAFPPDLRYYMSYTRLSFNFEGKLAALHYFEMLLDCGIETITLRNCPISPHSVVANGLVRTFELRYKSRLNMYYLKKMKFSWFENVYDREMTPPLHRTSWKLYDLAVLENAITLPYMPDSMIDPLDTIEYLVLDSIFCNLRIINGLKLIGLNYITGHSYMAFAHLYLAHWTGLYDQLKQTYRDNGELERLEELERKLVDLIGRNDSHYIDKYYCLKRAHQCFYQTISMHNEGKEYKNHIKQMYLAEDDLSDDNVHFCAAIERYLINIEEVRHNLRFIKQYISRDSDNPDNPEVRLYDVLVN